MDPRTDLDALTITVTGSAAADVCRVAGIAMIPLTLRSHIMIGSRAAARDPDHTFLGGGR